MTTFHYWLDVAYMANKIALIAIGVTLIVVFLVAIGVGQDK
jgi:hypothetical protein